MIRCETCLVALQIADREDNNCPDCKDYKGAIQNLISLEGERCKVCDNILQECECKKKGGKL